MGCRWIDKLYMGLLVRNTISSRSQQLAILFQNFGTRRRGRNGKENRDQLMRRLTFLFACLHARQAVEFFFGLLTAVDVCGANMRGGPGANAGNCFVFSRGLIFIFQKICLAEYDLQMECLGISDRNIPRLKLPRQWEFDEATICRNRLFGTVQAKRSSIQD